MCVCIVMCFLCQQIGDLLVAMLGNPVSMMSAISGAWYWSDKMCLWYIVI